MTVIEGRGEEGDRRIFSDAGERWRLLTRAFELRLWAVRRCVRLENVPHLLKSSPLASGRKSLGEKPLRECRANDTCDDRRENLPGLA